MTDAISSDVRPIETPKAPDSSGIPDAWFRGYIEGNNLVPQANGPITIFTLDAVLQEPPESWEQLSQSRMSPDQIAELGNIMTNAHEGQKIPIVSGVAREGQMHVGEIDLQKLWQETIQRIMKGVNYYYLLSQGRESGDDLFREAEIVDPEVLNKHFSTARGVLELKALRRAASIGKGVLKSTEARDLIKDSRRLTLIKYRSHPDSSDYNDAVNQKRRTQHELMDLMYRNLETENTYPLANQALMAMMI